MAEPAVQIRRQDLVASAHAIEPIPASIGRLAQLVADVDASTKEIVEVISYDQSLTANLMRRANSAALGGRVTIRTVHEAAVRLGPGTLLTMALSSSVQKKMGGAVPEYGLGSGELWRNSVTALIAAETIRSFATVPVPSEVSTAALLHDFGKIVLASHFGPQVLDMIKLAADNDSMDYAAAEEQIFGVNHADVGGMVAQKWGLPPTIVDAIVHHHAHRAGLPPVCGAVSLAHLVTDELNYRPNNAGERAIADAAIDGYAAVMNDLGIHPSKFGDLVEASRERFAEVAYRDGISKS